MIQFDFLLLYALLSKNASYICLEILSEKYQPSIYTHIIHYTVGYW